MEAPDVINKTAGVGNEGVVDFVREYRQHLVEAVLQELVERGLKISQVNTRKTFFQSGA